jgi:hypothetical protein
MWGKSVEGGFFSTPGEAPLGIEVRAPPSKYSGSIAPITLDGLRMFQKTEVARCRWAYVLESVQKPASGGFEPVDLDEAKEDWPSWKRGRFGNTPATLGVLEKGYCGGLDGGDLIWLEWTLRKMMVEDMKFGDREGVVRAWLCVVTNWWDPASFLTLVKHLHAFNEMDRCSWGCGRRGGFLESYSRTLYAKNVESYLWLKVLAQLDDLSSKVLGEAKRDPVACSVHATLEVCSWNPSDSSGPWDLTDRKAMETENWDDLDDEEL